MEVCGIPVNVVIFFLVVFDAESFVVVTSSSVSSVLMCIVYVPIILPNTLIFTQVVREVGNSSKTCKICCAEVGACA